MNLDANTERTCVHFIHATVKVYTDRNGNTYHSVHLFLSGKGWWNGEPQSWQLASGAEYGGQGAWRSTALALIAEQSSAWGKGIDIVAECRRHGVALTTNTVRVSSRKALGHDTDTLA